MRPLPASLEVRAGGVTYSGTRVPEYRAVSTPTLSQPPLPLASWGPLLNPGLEQSRVHYISSTSCNPPRWLGPNAFHHEPTSSGGGLDQVIGTLQETLALGSLLAPVMSNSAASHNRVLVSSVSFQVAVRPLTIACKRAVIH